MNTAAVTGANSMLGRCLTVVLQEAGVTVIPVGRHDEASIRLDLRTGLQSPVDVRAEWLFHCAANFADDSPEGTRENHTVNTTGCLHVLDLAERLGSRVLISAGTLSSRQGFDPNGMNSYCLTKAHGEELMAWRMGQRDGRFCSLRFPQLYDTAGDCIRHQPWFGRAIAYAAQGKDLNLPASDGPRSYMHIEDAARLMLAAATENVHGMLDAVHPEMVSGEELSGLAYQIFGQGAQARIAPGKTPFRKVHYPDGAEVFRLLGVSPAISLSEGITRIRDANTGQAFGPLDVT